MFCLHIFTPAPAQKAPAPTGSAKLPMSIILKKDILTGRVVLLDVVVLVLLGLVGRCCWCTLYNEKILYELYF